MQSAFDRRRFVSLSDTARGAKQPASGAAESTSSKKVPVKDATGYQNEIQPGLEYPQGPPAFGQCLARGAGRS